MSSNVHNQNTITWVRQQQQQKKFRCHISWISLLEGLDTRADLLSGSSAWALALELVSTGTGSALEFVSTDTRTALELMSTDTGSAWSWWSFLKWENCESHSGRLLQPSAYCGSCLWLLVVLDGMVWRTSPSLVALPTQYLQPVCQNR